MSILNEISYNNLKAVEALIAAKADVNGEAKYVVYGPPNHKKWESCKGLPLYKAVCKGNPKIVKALVTAKADVNLRPTAKVGNAENRTPLHVAIDQGYPEIAKILLEGGANVNAVAEAPNKLTSKCCVIL